MIYKVLASIFIVIILLLIAQASLENPKQLLFINFLGKTYLFLTVPYYFYLFICKIKKDQSENEVKPSVKNLSWHEYKKQKDKEL